MFAADSRQTPVGNIQIVSDGTAICALRFLLPEYGLYEYPGTDGCVKPDALVEAGFAQLFAYFSGARRTFDLPLAPVGTPFQQKVWRALCDVPYGQAASYREIARAVGNEKACRAVGMANHRNPIAIFIPCHRVIAADGGIGGYGAGIEIKRTLLALERGNPLL